ncbi:hypothetical protein DL96DRAFT_1525139 [Flagelloscypha sp. PMI_526]|nr:hypothetical protein DL96DRAFT_1525139 [Flagelloscypha sp. PMI_526]
MLQRLEEDQQLSSPARVCDYFDMICGSGLGGLLAIMCGILRMTGDQLVDEFLGLCKAVFSGQLDVTQRTLRLEEELKRMVAKFCEGGEGRRMFCEEDKSKTFVWAGPAHNTSHPRLFRNYRMRTNPNVDCMIWQAARATLAMPELFLPISIGPELVGEIFISGELGLNNPIEVLTEEAAHTFAGGHVTCIVNIGSGHPGHLSLANGLSDFFSRVALDCERAAERMERRFEKVPGVYKRLNVEQGMQNLNVDLGNLHEVASHAQSYLQGSRVTRNIDSLVLDLILRPERIQVDIISVVVPGPVEALQPKVCPQPTVYFTGRQTSLRTLEEYFDSDCRSCHVGVLYGIGGGGKTQIGLMFIQISQNRFSEVFFVDASDTLTLERGLRAIAAGSVENPSVDDALRVLRARRENWLLFLDNADDNTLDLRPHISWPHGNVLITTRNREVRVHAPNCSIWVDRLELEDARKLLLKGVDIHENSETRERAAKIVHELGYLALAINQARAFLANRMSTLDEYLPIYLQNRKELLEDRSIQTTDDYEHTVYTTWTISFDKLSPNAAFLLELLSYMHHDSIPCCLFEQAWEALENEEEGAVPQALIAFLSSFTTNALEWDVLQFRRLIREISSFSLLEFDIANSSISLHPLVQQWAQHHCQHNQMILNTSQTLISLATPLERSSQAYAMMNSLLPHLRESTKTGVTLHFTLLSRIGSIYRHGGMFRESLDIRQKAFSETQQQLGSEHPSTLDCMSQLAGIYLDMRQPQNALELNREVLELAKRVFGDEHPRTLLTMSNLGTTYSVLGQDQEALMIDQEVLGLMKQNLGSEHPLTLNSMGNLALDYHELGQYQNALVLNEKVLKLRERILGNQHPDTLLTMNNLARDYSLLGQHHDALKLDEEVLELSERVLGKDHPHILVSMGNLACDYTNLERHQDALELREALELRQWVLGNERPDTRSIQVELFRTTQAQVTIKPPKRKREIVKRFFTLFLKGSWPIHTRTVCVVHTDRVQRCHKFIHYIFFF